LGLIPAIAAIKRVRNKHQRNLEIKIKNLHQLAQKQLDDIIKNLLPKYRLILHPSHPNFTREYMVIAQIQKKYNEQIGLETELTNLFHMFLLTKAFLERATPITMKNTWWTRRNTDGEYC
jgi:aspartyl/asparaginyl-tRNA synthetase